jgi:hypothetical protein
VAEQLLGVFHPCRGQIEDEKNDVREDSENQADRDRLHEKLEFDISQETHNGQNGSGRIRMGGDKIERTLHQAF